MSKIEELKERVLKYRMLQLPGQPMAAHMGTSYLIGDLLAAVEEYATELDKYVDELADVDVRADRLQAENEDLQYEVDKLSGVLVCANNNCERRDKVIAELKAENERYREALIKIAEYNHPSNETIQIARDILGVKEPPALNASRKAGE